VSEIDPAAVFQATDAFAADDAGRKKRAIHARCAHQFRRRATARVYRYLVGARDCLGLVEFLDDRWSIERCENCGLHALGTLATSWNVE
jgi:hypothetical protein